MKYLLIGAMLLTTGCSVIQDPYFKVGAGYKVAETNMVFTTNGVRRLADDPISARVELGANCLLKEVTCGMTHRSQWFSGAPFNDNKEYSVTEFFIDYTFKFGE